MQKSKLVRVSRPGEDAKMQLNDRIGVDAGTKSFRRSLAFGAVVCLLCEKFVRSRCFAFRDSSSGGERLRIPSGRESESAVVLAVCNTCDPDITSKSCEKY
ncbi:hypothetical protein CDL15_Pgr021048 [Punica granatum]|uniref:Uncharacterized protein n=1 Tax=Punica granatum TaxID=22663 RepID=A0A218XJ51_PUNGR|nr:hypothetical protein CDL15_Pgr021048 [Punica granatum]PKI51918.1 hypothetical protein CRG98_027689 [Punica granatum]